MNNIETYQLHIAMKRFMMMNREKYLDTHPLKSEKYSYTQVNNEQIESVTLPNDTDKYIQKLISDYKSFTEKYKTPGNNLKIFLQNHRKLTKAQKV